MTGRAIPGVIGAKGFDINEIVTAAKAASFAASGYTFALRYIPRLTAAPGDLTTGELATLHAAGLAVMPVQHVRSETSWSPNASLGGIYGQTAADYCAALAVPHGVTVWLDLEGVAVGTPSADVIAYCTAWYNKVSMAGYDPGLYIGWHSGLSPAELYALPFMRYWAAYNLNADQEPATCGVCMRQHATDGEHQSDTVTADKLGRVPTVCAPPLEVAHAA